MNNHAVEAILDKAHEKCQDQGSKLTEKRRKTLAILVRSERPLSAYQIAAAFKEEFQAEIPVMSVYRILEFLGNNAMAHRLSSANKYVACSHISCDHSHEVSQFLICKNCELTKEITINKSLVEQFELSVTKAGFQPLTQQLEMDCLCNACAVEKSTNDRPC